MPPGDRRSHRAFRPASLLARATAAARQVPDVARQIPAVLRTERELHKAERVVLRHLRDRLDAVDEEDPLPLRLDAVPYDERAVTFTEASSRQRMRALLDESVEQTLAHARQHLHLWLLRQLLPDEARILAALADGTPYPLLHVALRTPLGSAGERLLQNASTVGRSAGVALVDTVPLYVTHLLALGLVEVGPENHDDRDAYDILLADDVVRRAQDQVGRHATRAVRRTLTISALGSELWAASQPTDRPMQ